MILCLRHQLAVEALCVLVVRLTDANRFYNLSNAISHSYGTDNDLELTRCYVIHAPMQLYRQAYCVLYVTKVNKEKYPAVISGVVEVFLPEPDIRYIPAFMGSRVEQSKSAICRG